MTRLVPLGLLVCLSSALAAPAPFLPKKNKKPAVRGLEGTTWKGNSRTYQLLPGGVLNYRYLSISATGTWRQEGDRVFWDVNKRFSWFEGRLEGGVIRGVAQNRDGKRWDLTVRPAPGAAMPPR